MGLESFPSQKEADNTACTALIIEKEVEKNIKEIRKNSDSGPHGITLGCLVKMHPRYSLLMEIFNLRLITRTIPAALSECRSVLIPESTKVDRLNDINNWRPITTASMVFRLFSRILMARLTKACPINPRQRGFIHAAGCSENLNLIQLTVKHAKKEHKEFGIVFVDTAKAFDTICHQHITMSLMQRGADPHIKHLVGKMYESIFMYIDTKKEKTNPFKCQTG